MRIVMGMLPVVAALIVGFSCAEAGESIFVGADNANIEYTDYISKELVDSPLGPDGKAMRFSRNYPSPNKGYDADNPGARIRFRTDAANLQAHLYYNDRHVSTSARNPKGFWLVDGEVKPEYVFTTRSASVVRKPEELVITLASGSEKKEHTYEIVLPYGDSVDFLGVSVEADAKFTAPDPRPAFKALFIGDSVTQGFTASDIGKTYAYLTALKMNWQLLNMGMAGAGSSPAIREYIKSIDCDGIVFFIGVNNWQGGAAVAQYKKDMKYLFTTIRQDRPGASFYVITSLWVAPRWKPKGATAELEEYRQALREVVLELADKNTKLIDGPDLIDHDTKLFDHVSVHPNDAGFAQMAERLSAAISK